jgi:hypothetical protein
VEGIREESNTNDVALVSPCFEHLLEEHTPDKGPFRWL